MSKLDNVPKKLMKTKFDSLGGYVKNADAKVNALTTKVKTLETTTRNAMKSSTEDWRSPKEDKPCFLRY